MKARLWLTKLVDRIDDVSTAQIAEALGELRPPNPDEVVVGRIDGSLAQLWVLAHTSSREAKSKMHRLASEMFAGKDIPQQTKDEMSMEVNESQEILDLFWFLARKEFGIADGGIGVRKGGALVRMPDKEEGLGLTVHAIEIPLGKGPGLLERLFGGKKD